MAFNYPISMRAIDMKNACLFCIAFLFCATSNLLVAQDEDRKPLKIFILAGQSNMEGKGSVVVMNHQLTVPEKRDRFARYKNGDEFASRDDVWIDYLGNQGRRHGKLTVGYGKSRPQSVELFGPELGFGWTVGDHFDEPILIIKTAWGGKSLDRDFRPPSRGYPDSLQGQFEKAKRNNEDLTLEKYQEGYGHFYRRMIKEIKMVTEDLSTYCPEYEGEGFEIAGMVWFQGWNDQYAPTSVEDYQENMIGFIQDVRSDLDSPKMVVVIGAMGHDGENQKGKVKMIADAQVAAANHPEFEGSVVAVRTSEYWDTEAEAAYKKYWADKPNRDIDKWREFGNDRGYHYLGSPKFFSEVGIAFGEAMIDLVK